MVLHASTHAVNATAEASTRWPRTVIWIHWATVALMTLAVGAILYRNVMEVRTVRAVLMQLHGNVGLLMGVLALLRLVARWRSRRRPALPGNLPARWAASAMHVLLVGLLLVMPVLGWALLSARGQVLHLPGLTWPLLLPADEDLAESLESAHAIGAWSLLALVGLHSAAALWHHWVRRDDVLRAMSLFHRSGGDRGR